MKTIEINGQKYELELRYCAVEKCNNSFWALKTSDQCICAIYCYETYHGKWKNRKQDPPILRKPKPESVRKRKSGQAYSEHSKYKTQRVTLGPSIEAIGRLSDKYLE